MPFQKNNGSYEIEYVLAKYLHLKKMDIQDMPMDKIRYFLDRLRKDANDEKEAMKINL